MLGYFSIKKPGLGGLYTIIQPLPPVFVSKRWIRPNALAVWLLFWRPFAQRV